MPLQLQAFLKRHIAPFSVAERLALIISVALAHAYFLACLPIPIIYDAAGYYTGAQGIVQNGLFSKFPFSEYRAYGYPFFLAQLMRVADLLGVPIRLVVMETQLALYVCACIMLRAILGRMNLPARLVRIAFVISVTHPFALIYPGFTLSEGLSIPLGLMLVAAAIWVACSADAAESPYAIAVAGSLCGLLQVVRPSNLYLLAFVTAAIVIGGVRQRIRGVTWPYYFSIALLCIGLTWVPQLANNITFYQKATIFPTHVAESPDSQILAIQLIKYGTLVRGNEDPHIYYNNPFYNTAEPLDQKQPFKWYRKHPMGGAATFMLHIFNVLDQDLPIPYNTELTPWYSRWVSLANLLVLSFAVIGFAGSRRYILKSGENVAFALLLLALVVFLQLGIQGPFHAETRFGVPSLIVLYIWAGWGALCYMTTITARGRMVAGAVVVVLTASGFVLSGWVRQQSPTLRAAQALHRAEQPRK